MPGIFKDSKHDDTISKFLECASEKEVSYYVFEIKDEYYISSGEKKTYIREPPDSVKKKSPRYLKNY